MVYRGSFDQGQIHELVYPILWKRMLLQPIADTEIMMYKSSG